MQRLQSHRLRVKFGPKEFTVDIDSNSANMASLSHHKLLVSTQENTLANLRKQTSSLGIILSPKSHTNPKIGINHNHKYGVSFTYVQVYAWLHPIHDSNSNLTMFVPTPPHETTTYRAIYNNVIKLLVP